MVLDMKRCSASHKCCFFRSCNESNNMHRIRNEDRYLVLMKHRFYIPKNVRACNIHFQSRSWNNVNHFRHVNTFNKHQIADMVDLLRFRHEKDETPDYFSSDMKILTGLTCKQFQQLFESVPLLTAKYRNNTTNARKALYMYLMRMRTGQTLQQMSTKFKVSHNTIINRLKTVRSVLLEEFVPFNLKSEWSRDELIANTTHLSRALYSNGNPNSVALIFDGTYIYVEKSGNQKFQKQTYSDQKKRNFIKIMMCVTTNGKIIFTSGPYAAVVNDAKILKSILQQNFQALSQLEPNDICLVDRGFRDCIQNLKAMQLDVRIPENIQKNSDGSAKKQLTTLQANLSRLVTKCRYAVEVRNGHMKCVWRLFKLVWTTKALSHLMADYRIGAALLNKFFADLVADEQVSTEVAARMHEKLGRPNIVQGIVVKSSFKSVAKCFPSLHDCDFFPQLTKNDLFMIALGVYQIAQAKNYCARHLTINKGQFTCSICPQDICEKFFHCFYTETSHLYLLLTRLLSRHISDKKYKTYLLIDANKQGFETVLGYYCDCKNGTRVIGCCSHVMSIIWYFGYARRNGEIHKVSAYLDNFFDGCDDATSSEED